MTATPVTRDVEPAASYDATAKQKTQAKTALIPIKIVPAEVLKKPDWIRVRAGSPTTRFYEIKQILREHKLHTVCEEASCPNIGECFGKGTATFMIMGDKCTRRCPFCDVGHGRPDPLDKDEPLNLAKTIAKLRLKYVVITSVDRDDLRDGGSQHFDARGGRELAHGTDAVGEVACAAVAQVVAVHAGDDHVLELQRSDGAREVAGLLGIRRQRLAVRDIAERAAARAQVAQDHESRRALAEAFADVGTARFFAHGVQAVFAQDALDFLEALAVAQAHADPVGLRERSRRHHLDRDACGLQPALLLFADGAHRSIRCRCPASSSPRDSVVPAMPRSRVCVTARPEYPQGSIAWKGERSMSTLKASP